MMKIKLFLILPLVFLLTGCWNYNELNEIAIVKGVSVDYKDNEYVVNYMISNASIEKGSGNSSKPQNALLEGKGRSVFEAITEINLTSPKKTYIGHMLVYIISEDIAKEGIKEVSDYFFRNNNSKKFFNLIISKDCEAKEILQILSPLDSFPSDNIAEEISSAESLEAFVANVTFPFFVKKILEEGIEATTNGITVIGSSKKGSEEKSMETSTIDNYIKIETLGIFKNDKLITWANENSSKGINLLLKSSPHLQLFVDCDDANVAFLVKNIRVKMDAKFEKNLIFTINVDTDSRIEEMSCDIDVDNEEGLKKLETMVKDELLNIIKESVNFTKEIKSDVLGFGNYMYLNHYEEWQKYKDDWNELYLPNIKVNYNVKTNLLIDENTNEGTKSIK